MARVKKVRILSPIWGLDVGDEVELLAGNADFAIKKRRAIEVKQDTEPKARKKKIDIEAENAENKSL